MRHEQIAHGPHAKAALCNASNNGGSEMSAAKNVSRQNTIRGPFGICWGSVRDPFGIHSGSVRDSFGVLSASVRGPKIFRRAPAAAKNKRSPGEVEGAQRPIRGVPE